jgi:hypothetical protein
MALKKIVATYILLFALFIKLNGIDNYLAGSRFGAMSNCGVAIPDVWSVSYNQAGLGLLEKPQFNIYHEQKFLIKEMGLSSLAAIYPFKPGTFGLQLNYFGYSKYHEMKVGVGFGKKLGSKISAGIQLDYFSTFLPVSYSKQQFITVELGLIGQLSECINVGFHVFNPLPKKSGTNNEQLLPSSAKLGLAYNLRKIVLLTAETEEKSTQSLLFRAGIEYLPVTSLALRLGYSTQNTPFSFGVGYCTKRLNFNLAFADHQQLGFTPMFDLGVIF